MLNEITNTTNENTTYANISNGLIVVRSDENDPKAKSRINKVGNTVYERFYRSIYGTITSINVEENKFGETDIRVGLKHDDKFGLLTFKLDSSYGRSFLAQIFNADIKRGLEFVPWSKVTDDGTKKTRLYLGYGKRESVEWKLPEGTPEVKWVQTKKGSVIDPVSKAEHDEFLDNKLQEFIKENDLVYNNSLSSVSEDEWNEMTQPLTAEEKAQLQKPKKEKVTTKSEITEADDDDFFNEL